jgi:hypothetical protein
MTAAMTDARRLAVGGLALGLALALACVAVQGAWVQEEAPRALLSRAAKAPPEKAKVPAGNVLAKQSFATWYQQQSAAAWFGDDTMHRKVQVGNQQFTEKSKKRKWLTKEDMKGIPAVLKAERAKKLKREAVQLAMARLAAKDRRGGLAKALKQQLAGYGDAHTQQLLQLQQLADDKEKIYKPIETEGDGPDLPEGRVFSIVKGLETKFLNRSTDSFAANKKHHEEPTPEQVAAENAAEEARKAEETKTTAVIATMEPKLQDIFNKQMKLKAEQADKLNELSKELDDVLTPQGYNDADITQCRGHCAEVQIAAEHTAEALKQRNEAEREEENRELRLPSDMRR